MGNTSCIRSRRQRHQEAGRRKKWKEGENTNTTHKSANPRPRQKSTFLCILSSHSVREARLFSDRGASTTSEFEWARELKIQRNEDICRGLGFVPENF